MQFCIYKILYMEFYREPLENNIYKTFCMEKFILCKFSNCKRYILYMPHLFIKRKKICNIILFDWV